MKLSKDNTINLEDFRAKDGHKISKVFTGRDRGLYVREQSKIDEIEQSYDEVKIFIRLILLFLKNFLLIL